MADAEGLIKKGEEKGEEKVKVQAILGFYEIGVSPENIAKALNITIDKVKQVLKEHKK